jgi:hypothetical protein
LRKDGNLEKQVARMLKDWRAGAFVRNFADQWLQIRNIWEVAIDPEAFPRWDDSLKGAMKEETERFFEALLKEDRPVTDLIDADFTFLNEKLARYYGIEGVKGNEFRRVTLPKDSPRGGVLTQGSVLLATSTPTRTSPVIRGKWILEQILGTPPPPPPPDVPQLAEQKQINQTSSVRQRLEQHRSRRNARAATPKWIRWGLPWRTSTPPAPGGIPTGNSPSTPPASWRTGQLSKARGNSSRRSRRTRVSSVP